MCRIARSCETNRRPLSVTLTSGGETLYWVENVGGVIGTVKRVSLGTGGSQVEEPVKRVRSLDFEAGSPESVESSLKY